MTAETGRPRLWELRDEVGWTQQQLADKLAYFAWTHGQVHAAVNADTVAKWERGVKGINPRYRALLCQLLASEAEQLGFAPAPSASPSSRPVHDAESLVAMLDDAASLLDHLAAALAHAERAPAVASWFASIDATIHADSGDRQEPSPGSRYSVTWDPWLTTAPIVSAERFRAGWRSWRFPFLRWARCPGQRRLHLLAPSFGNNNQGSDS